MNSALSKVPALEPKVLLRRLAEENHSPHLTLMLSSGASVKGSLVSCSSTVVLLESEASAAYVPMQSVVSVIVHGAPAIADILSFGTVDPSPPHPPTKLALRRELLSHATDLGQALGKDLEFKVDEFPEAPNALWSIALGIRELHAILIAIAAEVDGADALRESVRTIRVCDETAPNVSLASGTLRFAMDSGRGPEGRLSGMRLRQTIESLL